MKTNRIFLSLVAALIAVGLSGCGGSAGSRVGNPETTSAFPSNLAIASPTEVSDSSKASVSSFLTGSRPSYVTSMAEAQTQIAAMLEGTEYADCDFDIAALTEIVDDADCYGPEVDYEGHPEGSPSSGALPIGDVGLWTETNALDETKSEACAAAQMNALIANAENKAGTAQLALASMLCIANINAIELVATVDFVDYSGQNLMQDMVDATGMAVTFDTATLTTTTSSDTSTYSYDLTFTTTGSEPTTVTVNMTHTPLDDNNSTFNGNFNYRFSSASSNIINCDQTDITHAGSVSYEQATTTNLEFRVDEALYCGADVNPFVASDSLDPTDLYAATTNADGWSEDWSTFMASIDPTTTAGSYVYFWQAGRGDSNARVFNLILTEEESELNAVAYFGFGPSVDTEATEDAPGSDGHIGGFICNWAGPGNDHDYSALVQYQSMSPDSDGYYQATASNISYAPTTSCDYRTTDNGFGSFRFDQDGSGSIDSGDASGTTEITNELLEVTDADADGYLDEIGITFPIL